MSEKRLNSFAQVPDSVLSKVLTGTNLDVLATTNLIVVEYLNADCHHSTYALMQIQNSKWIMPITIDVEPTLTSIGDALDMINYGAKVVNGLKLDPVDDAKKLLEIGTEVTRILNDVLF